MVRKIKQLCEERGITLRMLEKELNFGNGTIVRWDVSRPNIDRVAAVAKFFGKTVDYFVE